MTSILDFTTAILGGDLPRVRQAIVQGANVNAADGDMTPLTWAILAGHLEVVRILLENGADPNFRPREDSSWPLWSAEVDFGFSEVAELLKAYGARQ